MTPANLLDEITSRLSQLRASGPAADFEKNSRALLSGLLGRLDLVSREEFDVQRDLLERAQEQIRQLEARIADLEKR